MQKRQFPYRSLGERLQSFRKKSRETLPEVSGAVELEADIIASYERGETRPSEDVLDLLIRHFDIAEDEADELWELAGYSEAQHVHDIPTAPTLVMIPMDNRIVYTDTANVTINNYGVVMNFMQNGINNQPAAVARVGMSLEHAKSVLEVLGKTIKQAEAAKRPKFLPNPQQQQQKDKTKD